MGVIATLLPNEVHLHRVRTAVRDRHELVLCADWSHVREICEARPIRLVIADLFASGQAAFERIRQLKRRWPRLTVLMYSAITADRVHDVFDAGRQGIDVLIIADQDDTPRALLAHIERAEARSLTWVLKQSLDGYDDTARDAILLAVTRAHENLSSVGLAKLLALPRPVLTQRLASAGFPRTRRLLTWGRLIMAAHLLEDPGRPADRVAASLGFPSGGAFRNVCQRYLHSTPSEIRRRGGALFVTRALLRQVRPPGAEPRPARHAGLRQPSFAI